MASKSKKNASVPRFHTRTLIYVITCCKHRSNWRVYDYTQPTPTCIMEIPIKLEQYRALQQDQEKQRDFYFNDQWKHFADILDRLTDLFPKYLDLNRNNLTDYTWLLEAINSVPKYVHDPAEENVIIEMFLTTEGFIPDHIKKDLNQRKSIRLFAFEWGTYEFDDLMGVSTVNLEEVLEPHNEGISEPYKQALEHKDRQKKFIHSVSYEFDHLYQH